MLTWDGDPYAGQIDVEALHTLRANVTPLVGEINGQGRRMENVHVSLLLDGDMLQPDIDFALGAPDAENVVQSAMASVLVDDAERTAQAIALLSLQEFLPNQFNSLSLGTEGLQSNSVDMLTSQVSRWLSNLNDDVEIGLVVRRRGRAVDGRRKPTGRLAVGHEGGLFGQPVARRR